MEMNIPPPEDVVDTAIRMSAPASCTARGYTALEARAKTRHALARAGRAPIDVVMLTPIWTLSEADALVPFLTEHYAALRGSIARVRAIDEELTKGRRRRRSTAPAATAGSTGAASATPENEPAAAAEALRSERAELEAGVGRAVAELWRVGAMVRLDPLSIEVSAVRFGEPVQLALLDGAAAFSAWRDDNGELHSIEDADAFGPTTLQ
jgi:hypothetical protein